MRVIEERMLNAVRNNRNLSCGNTQVVRADVENGGRVLRVYLHGNNIYAKDVVSGVEKFSACGWLTNTTKSRLNALGANIYQKDWSWYNADGTPFKSDNMWNW